MSKVIKDAEITTRAARSRREPGLHWRVLDAEVHIGYRKGARAGRWLVRWRAGTGYKQEAFAAADDFLEADGKTTLTFDQACRAARNIVQGKRVEAALTSVGPIQTVRKAAEAYAAKMEERQAAAGRRVLRDTRSRFQRHLFEDELANQPLAQIKSSHLRQWRDRLRAKLAPASLQRCCNDLRAALNEVGRESAAMLPERFPLEIRDGFAASTVDRVATATRPNVVLSDPDVRRIISASQEIDSEDGWEGDLAALVLALAATGARFSQIARCRVVDVQFDTKRLMVPVSRKGRGIKAASHTAVAIGDDVIAVLRPLVVRRRGHEALFQRWGYRRAGRLQWERDSRRPWEAAEISEPFRRIVERAELSADVTAYALRHSSIVRGLRAGLPVRLVAALHDTSSEMIEKHYSAHIVDAMTDAARLAVVPLIESGSVVALRAV